MSKPLHSYFRTWSRAIANVTLFAVLMSAVNLSLLAVTPSTVRAERSSDEARTDLWGDMPDTLVFEPFPAEYSTDTSQGGASPRVAFAGTTTLTAPSPVTGEVKYTEATVDVTVKPFAGGGATAIGSVKVPATQSDLTYSWDGSGLKDGLYRWTYQFKPVAPPPPPPCEGDCPPPEPINLDPIPGGDYPVIIDRTAPRILGLRNPKESSLYAEVQDVTSGVEKVEVQFFKAGQAPGSPLTFDLKDHPRHALISIPVLVAGADIIAQVTLTDLAGNTATESLPLFPAARTAQFGAGAPWPVAATSIGGQPQVVNLASGNGYFAQSEMAVPLPNMALDISRSYNHQDRHKGLLGWGWRLSLEANLTLWPNGLATWQDPSGTEYTFRVAKGSQAKAYVDGIGRAWPRLQQESDESFRLRWASGESIRFSKNGKVATYADYRGNARITYNWSDTGRLTQITTVTDGPTVDFTYNPDSTLEKLTLNAAGSQSRTISFTYEDGNLTKAVGIDGRTAEFDYDPYHRITSIKNTLAQADGAAALTSETTWAYGAENKVTDLLLTRNDTDSNGTSVAENHRIDYQEDDLAWVTDPLGVTAYRWDHLNRPLRMARRIDEAENIWAIHYYTFTGHKLVRYTDPLNRATSFTYTDKDDITLTALPDEQQSKTANAYEYDANDQVTKMESRELAQVDGAETVISLTTTTFKNGRPVTVVGPRGATAETTQYEYDGQGQMTRAEDPHKYVTAYSYNALGQVTRVADWPSLPGGAGENAPEAEWTETQYDGFGLVKTATTKLAGTAKLTTEYALDLGTNKLTVTEHQPADGAANDAGSTRTAVAYMKSYLPGARPLQVVRSYVGAPPAGEPAEVVAASYTYNSAGMPTKVKSPADETEYRYDGLGNLISQKLREALALFEYDTAGRLSRQVNTRKGFQEYTYDLANQLKQVTVAYTDPATTARVVESETRYEYDPLGRVTRTVSPIDGTTQVTYKAVADGYVTKVTNTQPHPDPKVTQPIVTETEEHFQPGTGQATRRIGEKYTFVKPVTGSTQVEMAYKRLVDGQWLDDGADTFRYDGRGRVVAKKPGAAAATNAADTATWVYDGLNRPIKASTPKGKEGTEQEIIEASYDASGALASFKADGKSSTFTYNLMGSPLTALVDGKATTYTYDAQQRLAQLKFGSTATYTYGYTKGYLTDVTATQGAYTGKLFHLDVDPSGYFSKFTQGAEAYGFSYDPLGRPTQITTPWNKSYQFNWQVQTAGTSSAAPAPVAAGESTLVIAASRKLALAGTTDAPLSTATTGTKPAGLVYDQVMGGYLFSQTHPDGTVTQTVIDGRGHVVARVDNLGRVTKYAYDETGRLKSRTDAEEGNVSFTYDSRGRILTETDARGKRTAYRYEENGLKVIKTDPLGNTTAVRTDVRGRPLAVTDANGNTTRYEYNALGNLTQITSPTGAVTSYEYDGAGTLTKIIDPRGMSTTYARDDLGRVTAITDGEGYTETVVYNHQGKVVAHTNKEQETTGYDYNSAGRLTSMKDAKQQEKTYTRDAGGLLLSKKDAAKNVTTYSYNSRNWLVKVEEPGGKVTEYQYDEVGRRTYQKDPQGNEVHYGYDKVGRLAREQFGTGLYIDYSYDKSGNLLTKRDSMGIWTTNQYDDLNRLTRKEKSDGTWVTYTYDNVGNVATETTPAGTKTLTYTPDNRVASVTAPNGSTTEYEYDPAGNVVKEKVDGVERDIAHDGNNRVTKITDGLGYEYSYVYDKDGYVKQIQLPNGLKTVIDYDERHNIVSQTTAGPNGVVSSGEYGHEERKFVSSASEDGRNYGYVYDGRGQMSEVTNHQGDVIKYYYDGAGNLVKREAVMSGASVDKHESITVDELMAAILQHLKEQEKEEESAEPEDPNVQSRMERRLALGADLASDVGLALAKGGNGNGNPGGNGNGNPGGTGNGNGKPETPGNGHGKPENPGKGKGSGYDKTKGKPSSKACEHALTKGKGAKVGLYRKCGEDLGLKQTGLVFNLLSIIDNLVNGEYYLPPGDKEDLFQLVRDAAEGYTIVGTTYEYDYGGKNRLISRHNLVRDEVHPYTYDDRGNLISNGRSKFTWDAEGRLVQTLFPDGEGVRYTYDPAGRRATKTTFNAQGEGEHTTSYEYEGHTWNVARERNKDGELVASYTYDLKGRPLTITYAGSTYWYVYNAHGDVVALTDREGQVKAWYEYDEWGRLEAMYDETGRVREGYGTIGDIGTGPTRPATGKPTPGTTVESGKGKKNGSVSTQSEPATEPTTTTEETGELQIQGVIGEPTDLVKMNPYRYAGYRYDRDTQYYYLQQRYLDTRLGRFLSMDTWQGDVRNPLTLNRYVYAINSPTNLKDPTGRRFDESEPSRGYRSRKFYAPPAGPSEEGLPDGDQTLFIQFLYDIGEDGYGDRTREKVRELQEANSIPVDDQVMIGPFTWALLVERFNDWVASTDGTGAPWVEQSPVLSVNTSSITQDTWKGNPWEPWTQNLYVYVHNNSVNFVDHMDASADDTGDSDTGLTLADIDNGIRDGLSKLEKPQFDTCLAEEAKYGSPQASGCYMLFGYRFGSWSESQTEIVNQEGWAQLAASLGTAMAARKLLKAAAGRGEVMLARVNSYERARNTMLDLIGEELGSDAKATTGKFGVAEGKINGMQSADGKVRWRLEWDPQKGAHINVENFRGSKPIRIAIPFGGDEATVEALLRHLNR